MYAVETLLSGHASGVSPGAAGGLKLMLSIVLENQDYPEAGDAGIMAVPGKTTEVDGS
jgi:hypothetical protein